MYNSFSKTNSFKLLFLIMLSNSKFIHPIWSKLNSLDIENNKRRIINKSKSNFQMKIMRMPNLGLSRPRTRLVKKFVRVFKSRDLKKKRYNKFYTLFRSKFNSKLAKLIIGTGSTFDSKAKKYALKLLNWKKSYNRIKLAYKFQRKNKKLLKRFFKINEKTIKAKSKSLYKYLKFKKWTLTRLGFWKFIIKPIIFWFIYYFNIFFIYYFKTLFSLWIRRLMFFFNNNIKLFFFSTNDLNFNNFLWYYSSELLICKIKPLFFFKKQFYYFNNFFNRMAKGNTSPFNTVHIDFFLNLKRIKYLFSNKKVWSRRYKITFAYVQLLKLHLFKTVEIGGWSRSTKNPRRNKYYIKTTVKFNRSRRVLLNALKYYLKKPKYGLKKIKRRNFFKRLRKSQHYKFVQALWDKAILRKRPKGDTSFLKKRKVKNFWSALFERTFYIRNARKAEQPNFIMERKKKKRDLKKYIERLKKRAKARSAKREYTPEQKIIYSRYKRFKARCNISCSYFDWIDHFKDTALENVCDTSNWKPYGWQVPSEMLQAAISALPPTVSISFNR